MSGFSGNPGYLNFILYGLGGVGRSSEGGGEGEAETEIKLAVLLGISAGGYSFLCWPSLRFGKGPSFGLSPGSEEEDGGKKDTILR